MSAKDITMVTKLETIEEANAQADEIMLGIGDSFDDELEKLLQS